jgi:hypothetical protein
MGNELASITFALAALLYTVYLVYFKIKRASILEKYKPGTASYGSVSKIFTIRKLIISIIATLILVVYAVSSVRSTKNFNVHALLFLLALLAIGLTITYFAIRFVLFGSSDKKKQ